jgi:hypothetical protein
VIYPAVSEKVQANWVHDINPDTHDLRFSVSPSGWTNDDLGVAWLQQVFDPVTSKKKLGESSDYSFLTATAAT